VTEPTTTQTVRALIERQGLSAVGVTLLRTYWKPVVVTAGVVFSFGKIMQQGEDMKGKLSTIEATQAQIQAAQAAQGQQNAAVNTRLGNLETQWGALFSAAHINVVPNPPPAPAPAEARKGRVKR
jgi:hypothetical protein